MNKEQILEGNKLICAFMGVKPKLIGNSYVWSDSPFFSSSNSIEEKTMKAIVDYAKYHSSWDWLMTVVEKIESYLADDCNVEIGFNVCSICVIVGNYFEGYTENDGFDILAHGSTRIEAVYNAVMEFITWYNGNK